ncbi:DNA-directed RNA polymerase III subunit RPC4 [Carex littledalei]|uniref:DNA-directed RNA polymerase III subunit RPC4 n=1 Tax=Carex littledalei TaxID=544730 RepID=A0A833VB24_9POAL|nr:DNA-directed RNA polymerase III subunit RPC4 [Carex littledalei]
MTLSSASPASPLYLQKFQPKPINKSFSKHTTLRLPDSPSPSDYASAIDSCHCSSLARQIHAHIIKCRFSGHFELLETRLLAMARAQGLRILNRKQITCKIISSLSPPPFLPNNKQFPLRLSLPPAPAAALPLSTLSWILKMKKETDTKPASKNKMKFVPRRPTQKKPTVPKIEPTNIKEEPMDTDLLQHIKTAMNNAGFGRRMPKTEEKVKAKMEQIAFGATTSYTTFGASVSFTGLSSSKVDKEEKEYEFPWDDNSNYPITLPLREDRRDPKILNEEEFGGSLASPFVFGTELDPASKLGLSVKSEIPQMIFFQLPAMLPLSKPDTGASSSRGAKKGCKLRELSAGHIGKLLVYKSGKVKMKFGENLFDVYPGSECKFSQDVAVVDLKEKQCCVIGQLGKERAIVIPDIDSMLDSTEVKTK